MFKIAIEKDINKYLKSNEELILNDLKKLIKIKSTLQPKKDAAPLGKGVKEAFVFMEELCHRDNLIYKNYDNYAFEIILGNGKKDIGILHHIDVVDIYDSKSWKSEPFKLCKKDRELYGRGVNDNKGPLIYTYYMIKYLSQSKDFIEELNRNNYQIKLIIGGAEETTWEGIEYYKKQNKKEPYFSFSPDGNYPVVFLEKGILKLNLSKKLKEINNFKITSKKQFIYICNDITSENKNDNNHYTSEFVKGRNPHRLKDNNALEQLFNYIFNGDNNELKQEIKKIENSFLKSFNGEKLNIQSNGVNGENSIAITSLNLVDKKLSIYLDIRFNQKITKEKIIERIRDLNYKVEIKDFDECHYVDPDSKNIKILHESYKKLTNSKEKPMFFSGKSYARAFKNSVAFGVSFAGEITRPHGANETQNLDSLILSTKILTLSLRSLIRKE